MKYESEFIHNIPVKCVNLLGCVCPSGGCCALLKVELRGFPLQRDILPTSVEPVDDNPIHWTSLIHSRQKGTRQRSNRRVSTWTITSKPLFRDSDHLNHVELFSTAQPSNTSATEQNDFLREAVGWWYVVHRVCAAFTCLCVKFTKPKHTFLKLSKAEMFIMPEHSSITVTLAKKTGPLDWSLLEHNTDCRRDQNLSEWLLADGELCSFESENFTNYK